MNTDDPKFTAHLLGELDELTAAERAEIEALIRADASAAAAAAETQALAARLRLELQREEAQPLTAAQRATVLAASAPGARVESAKVIPFPRRLTVLSAIAACLIVGVSIALIFRAMDAERNAADRTMAKSETPPQPTIDLAQPPSPEPQSATGVPEAPALTNPSLLADAKSNATSDSPSTEMPRMMAKKSPPVARVQFEPANAPGSAPVLAAAPAPPAPDSLVAARPTAPFALRPASPAPSRGVAETKGRIAGGGGAMPRGDYAKLKAGAPRSVGVLAEERFYDRLDKSDEVGGKDGETIRRPSEPGNTEAFDAITDNAFLAVRENPLSTFSIDVDTASYAIVRRFLNDRQLPPKGAVRIEELLNYFTYRYPQPEGDAPFSATMEVATCPWTPEHRLVRIGLKGREIAKDKRPASNLVFLIDVSGSMSDANKLPLLKQSLGLLIDQLGAEDRVGIVVYAGSSGCVLQPTHDKAEMRLALDRLEAGGSTNGASGIQLAYELAQKSFIKGGTNRVILATDGDWNVGVTNQSDLLEMIAKKAKGGVFLTVLGFGMGNLKDAMLVKLADKGNGNYAYLDTLLEAKKVLVEQFSGTLVTIAKDVKIQVEFNPAQVSGYRLIGYEKRLLAKEDFNDDKKDAGEIGAGHTVTALYEVVPAGKDVPELTKVDALKYQPSGLPQPPDAQLYPTYGPGTVLPKPGHEMLTLKLRYKAPDGDTSKLLEFPLTDAGATWEKSSRDFRFAAAVAGYGMLLRDSPHKGQATWNSIHELAVEGQGDDATGYRAEFLSLLEKAKALTR
ncbi:MAG: von Willebrand factor type A domain-containing protein [Chthoniobacter sp.]|nr:von Willebrand factor type A domain-containing protein [Chthoniobacter sp.]